MLPLLVMSRGWRVVSGLEVKTEERGSGAEGT